MPVSAGARQDTQKVTVRAQIAPGGALTSIGNGEWSRRSGGRRTATTTKHRPGGVADERDYGGPATTENVTVSKVFDAVSGDTALYKRLTTVVGRGSVEITHQPLDGDLIPFGDPIIWRGTLVGVTAPEQDSNSSSTTMLELEVSVTGSIG